MSAELRHIFAPPIMRRNLVVMLVVGTILNLINQGDAFLIGVSVDWLKLCLTYCVPFFVASYGSYNSLRSMALATIAGDGNRPS